MENAAYYSPNLSIEQCLVLLRLGRYLTRRIRNNSALSQAFIAGPTHFDRRAARAVVAPMALVTFQSLARAAIVAHKNIGLLLFIAGMKRHNFLFEILRFRGRITSSFNSAWIRGLIASYRKSCSIPACRRVSGRLYSQLTTRNNERIVVSVGAPWPLRNIARFDELPVRQIPAL